MDKQSQKKLEEILRKDPSALTPGDKVFLLARKSYVGRTSRRKFANVFAPRKK